MSLLAALAAEGGRFSEPLDILADLAPFWLACALVVLVCALLFLSGARRWLCLGLSGAGAFAASLLVAPEMAKPSRPRASPGAEYQIKLIQYNAWERNPEPRRDASWLAAQNADLLLVEDAEAPIRQALERHGYLFTHGVADTAIFSRRPVARGGVRIARKEWPKLPSFAAATFESPAGPFTVLAVHLQRRLEGPQAPRAAAFAELVDRYDPTRLIVAGDFNLTPWSFALRRLDHRFGVERRDRALYTWPANYSPLPFLPIDHLYAGAAWRMVSLQRGPRLGSDHYPVVATLALTR